MKFVTFMLWFFCFSNVMIKCNKLWNISPSVNIFSEISENFGNFSKKYLWWSPFKKNFPNQNLTPSDLYSLRTFSKYFKTDYTYHYTSYRSTVVSCLYLSDTVSWPKKNLMISKGHSSGRDIFKQFFVLSKTLYYFLRTTNFLP